MVCSLGGGGGGGGGGAGTETITTAWFVLWVGGELGLRL